MKKAILFSSFLFFYSSIELCFSQSPPPPSSMEVFMEVAPNDTNNLQNYNDSVFFNLTQLKSTMALLLEDTTNVINIHVKLGTTLGSSDLLNKIFVFDQSGIFMDGTSYKRENEVIYLGLGNFIGINTYYAEAKLEYANAVFSQSIYFNN
ncbi:MAG: hypothetical protein ACHQNT_06890 [Bacteroidia bacterium]